MRKRRRSRSSAARSQSRASKPWRVISGPGKGSYVRIPGEVDVRTADGPVVRKLLARVGIKVPSGGWIDYEIGDAEGLIVYDRDMRIIAYVEKA